MKNGNISAVWLISSGELGETQRNAATLPRVISVHRHRGVASWSFNGHTASDQAWATRRIAQGVISMRAWFRANLTRTCSKPGKF